MTRLLSMIALALLAAGCAGGGSKQPSSEQGESKSSMISDLQSARLEASTLAARKLLFTKVKGSFGKGEANGGYVAFYQGDVLRIVEEETEYGTQGKSSKSYYLDSQGRLYYFTASEKRVKQGTKDKVKIRIAYDESANVVGSEKNVNGQSVKLSDAEARNVKARLEALRKAAQVAKVATSS